ncbi:MAG: peptide ABC transporter substrate-binding protein [Chloroflexota bacterium]
MSPYTRFRTHRSRLPVLAMLLLVTILAACQMPTRPAPTDVPDPSSPTPQAPPTEEATPLPTPTATPVPPKELTICQGEEPDTLFIYGALSQAARNVLDAVYDGPIDVRSYRPEAVILERLPTLENGDAVLRTVEVTQGDAVLDAGGEVVSLVPGVALRNSVGEKVTFQSGVLTTTQMVVTFTLRADVTWSDGQPLTVADSRYAYQVVEGLDDPALRRRVERTASYETVDERTVVWTGVPGYRDTYFVLNFYHPLPRHVLADLEVEELPQSDLVRRRPLGWGPFVVEEWVEGESITLLPNPHYFRAPEGLPYLDRVTFRFIGDAQQATDDLVAGRCDVLTRDLIGDEPPSSILEAVEDDEARLISSAGSEWEHLDFAVQPVPWSDQVPFFADVRVRQAVAYCTDRERIAREAFPRGEAVLAHSYVPPQHPVYAADELRFWQYDPAAGRSLLGQAGWQDTDGDGILEAQAVSGVVAGTPFSVTLLTTAGDPAREGTAEILQENLASCGIRLGTRALPVETFYADGPDGPLFGRQFDLALFSWLNGLDAPCELYLSTNIPREENWWATSNNPGYSSQSYDQACRSALEAVYGTDGYVRHHREAQVIFSQDLPVLPLYFVPRLLALHPEVRGSTLDPSQLTPFWNIEELDFEW